jgi:Integrase core domain
LTVRVGHPHPTISKVLARHGLSRPPKKEREPERRYEWPCPGELLHIDVTRYARFNRPGPALTGDRTSSAAAKRERVGDHDAHAIVDDHSRLAYGELHPDERAATVTAFLASKGVHHLTTEPYRPRTNGKVERFHQTMAREWAYGQRYRSSRHRATALPHWLAYYNQRRPHSSLGGLPPTSRVHNLCGQDT